MKNLFYIILSVAVLVMAGSTAYYFVWYLPKANNLKVAEAGQQQTLANQQKCATDAMRYYSSFYASTNDANEHYLWDTPEFHFNAKLNTCLLFARYIQMDSSNSTLSTQYNQIIDVYANKVILYGWFNRDVRTTPPKEDVGTFGNDIDGVPNYTSTDFFAQKQRLFSE